mgnify:CR=1 FL=1
MMDILDLQRAIECLQRALECWTKVTTTSHEPVGRSQSGPFTVSTVRTSDLNVYETAILDKEGAHPVERYETRGQAEKGHAYWTVMAMNLEEITKLGHPLMGIEDQPYQLVA